jgi:hypothetical protein
MIHFYDPVNLLSTAASLILYDELNSTTLQPSFYDNMSVRVGATHAVCPIRHMKTKKALYILTSRINHRSLNVTRVQPDFYDPNNKFLRSSQ